MQFNKINNNSSLYLRKQTKSLICTGLNCLHCKPQSDSTAMILDNILQLLTPSPVLSFFALLHAFISLSRWCLVCALNMCNNAVCTLTYRRCPVFGYLCWNCLYEYEACSFFLFNPFSLELSHFILRILESHLSVVALQICKSNYHLFLSRNISHC